VLGLELSIFTEPLHQPFIMMGSFETGSHELFPWAGFKPRSSGAWQQRHSYWLSETFQGRRGFLPGARKRATLLFGQKKFFFFLWWDWGLNPGLHTCKNQKQTNKKNAGAVLLEQGLQSILLFWRWGCENCLPGLVLNLHPPISASQIARIRDESHGHQAP
jgi:hypothetical protein